MDGFGLAPLAGGHGGETFVAESAGERTVVRVYARRGAHRGPEAPAVDAAVLRLVRGLLPVADVLEVRRAAPDGSTPGLLVTSFLPGTRLDVLLPSLDPAARVILGRHLGALVARLATMPMARPGSFVDADLRVEPRAARDLADLVREHRAGPALADWPAAAYDGLLRVADEAQVLLDRVGRTCLVHGDLDPSNLLVDPVTLEVTGLVDWELAHAGLPGTDVGHLLRFERDPVLTEAVVDAYVDLVPEAPGDVLDVARAADLAALVDLAGRRGDDDPVAGRAHGLLRAVAEGGDLHAPPPARAGLDAAAPPRVF